MQILLTQRKNDMRLEINAGFNLQVAGEYNQNGTPKTMARIVDKKDPREFGRNVDILQEMVDLWNAKNATK
jgi:hypothetical protein